MWPPGLRGVSCPWVARFSELGVVSYARNRIPEDRSTRTRIPDDGSTKRGATQGAGEKEAGEKVREEGQVVPLLLGAPHSPCRGGWNRATKGGG